MALYAGTAAGMGLSLAGVWIYATRHRFTPADMGLPLIRDIRLNLLLPPLVFLLSAVVALFSANLAMYLWFLCSSQSMCCADTVRPNYWAYVALRRIAGWRSTMRYQAILAGLLLMSLLACVR